MMWLRYRRRYRLALAYLELVNGEDVVMDDEQGTAVDPLVQACLVSDADLHTWRNGECFFCCAVRCDVVADRLTCLLPVDHHRVGERAHRNELGRRWVVADPVEVEA